jgi:hypothetical protein
MSGVLESYYAITIGLCFERKLEGNDLRCLTPSEWPRKDQDTFWAEFLRCVDQLREQLIPKGERRASLFLVDDHGLKIERNLSNPEEIEAAKNWIMDFGKTSERQLPPIEKLPRLLAAIDSANTPHEKGRTLEQLVAALFSTIDGFAVDAKNVKTETEEIDLTISNGSDDPKWRREEAIILVECKNWSSKCGKNEFVEFKSKMENRKARCSLGFLISWNGFADTITKEMIRGSRERLLIVPLDGKQIEDAVRENSFNQVLMSAWNEATMR